MNQSLCQGTTQAVVRQSSNCYESVIFCAAAWTESLLSLFLAKICRLFENCVKKKNASVALDDTIRHHSILINSVRISTIPFHRKFPPIHLEMIQII